MCTVTFSKRWKILKFEVFNLSLKNISTKDISSDESWETYSSSVECVLNQGNFDIWCQCGKCTNMRTRK